MEDRYDAVVRRDECILDELQMYDTEFANIVFQVPTLIRPDRGSCVPTSYVQDELKGSPNLVYGYADDAIKFCGFRIVCRGMRGPQVDAAERQL